MTAVTARLPSWLLTLYLGVALVYWLPDVSVALVSTVKTALFLAALGAAFGYVLQRGVLLPDGLWGPVGCLALAALATPGVVQSELTLVLKRGVDFAPGIAFAWCFFNLTRLQVDVGRILVRATAVVSLLATVPIANKRVRPAGLAVAPNPHARLEHAGISRHGIRTSQ